MTYNVFGGTLSLTQSINQPGKVVEFDSEQGKAVDNVFLFVVPVVCYHV